MFTSLELGRGEDELGRPIGSGSGGGKSNPLLASIVDGVETLRALVARGDLKAEDVAAARAIIVMRTDKIGFGISVTQGYGLLLARTDTNKGGGAGGGAVSGGGGGGHQQQEAATASSSSPPSSPWSAPLPLKVDGFSLGAVAGYSEQRSVVLLGSDDDVAVFLKV